jgi:hypothetical protein
MEWSPICFTCPQGASSVLWIPLVGQTAVSLQSNIAQLAAIGAKLGGSSNARREKSKSHELGHTLRLLFRRTAQLRLLTDPHLDHSRKPRMAVAISSQ